MFAWESSPPSRRERKKPRLWPIASVLRCGGSHFRLGVGCFKTTAALEMRQRRLLGCWAFDYQEECHCKLSEHVHVHVHAHVCQRQELFILVSVVFDTTPEITHHKTPQPVAGKQIETSLSRAISWFVSTKIHCLLYLPWAPCAMLCALSDNMK